MTIFITGGAGFIGSNFIHHWFKNEEESIVNIDCLTYAGNINNIKKFENNENYKFVKTNIGDTAKIQRCLLDYKPRAIINFAAESHVDRSIFDPTIFFKTNVLETLNLLNNVKDYFEELSEDQKNKFRFIHISTDEVYGSLKINDKPFSEDNKYMPNSPYAASKASSDHLVRSYSKTFNLPCIISNCSNNYGPFQYPEKLIPLVILNALSNKKLPIYGKGDQIRDWLHVDDHCIAIKTILKNGIPSETYNIGGLNELQNIDVVKIICFELDKMQPREDGLKYSHLIEFVDDRPGHDTRYAIDATKIKSQLGWEPSVTFREGIKRTIEWYLKNSDWIKSIKTKSYDSWISKNYDER